MSEWDDIIEEHPVVVSVCKSVYESRYTFSLYNCAANGGNNEWPEDKDTSQFWSSYVLHNDEEIYKIWYFIAVGGPVVRFTCG